MSIFTKLDSQFGEKSPRVVGCINLWSLKELPATSITSSVQILWITWCGCMHALMKFEVLICGSRNSSMILKTWSGVDWWFWKVSGWKNKQKKKPSEYVEILESFHIFFFKIFQRNMPMDHAIFKLHFCCSLRKSVSLCSLINFFLRNLTCLLHVCFPGKILDTTLI